MTHRKSLCVDFDRVLHQYTTPWSHPLTISDLPVEGAFAWLTEMVEVYDINVYSSRSDASGGIEAMYEWFEKHGLPESVLSRLLFPLRKPPAVLYIDDRAFHFRGRFPTRVEVDTFKPWHPDDNKPRPVEEFIPDPVDVEERIERLVRSLVTIATDSSDAPLASYSGEYAMPDGRTYRCSIDLVEE